MTGRAETLLARRGAWIAAGAAALAAAPGAALPYLADDWANLSLVAEGVALRTPFGYFRPLYLATFRAEYLSWGAAPVLSHLLNILLLATAAALVAHVVRRYTSDAGLAGWAGLLFAIHPVHVACAAWVAARADLLSGVLGLAALLLYDRWRASLRGAPLGALLCLAAASLVKEAVVVVPVLLALVALVVPGRRPSRSEIFRGLLPMFALAVSQTLVQGMMASGAAWDRIVPDGARVVRTLVHSATAAIVPVQAEVIQTWPWRCVSAAAVGAAILLWLARSGTARVAGTLVWSVLAFGILLGPAPLFSFQQRFLFLPSAAAALAIACTLRAGPRTLRRAVTTVLAAGWLVALVAQWQPWFEAAAASERVVADLVAQSRKPSVEQVVVANMPQRVHGAPLAGDFGAAVRLSGGRDVEVRCAVYVDLPSRRSESLDGDLRQAVVPVPAGVVVSLRVPRVPFSRAMRGPSVRPGGGSPLRPTIEELPEGRWRVRIPWAPGRAILVWTRGELLPVAEHDRLSWRRGGRR